MTILGSERLMNIREFLRGGYREITEPTTVLSGTTRLFVAIPESWMPLTTFSTPDPRSARPDGEGAGTSADSPVSPDAPVNSSSSVERKGSVGARPVGADGTGEQTEAPESVGAPAPRRVRGAGIASPAPRPTVQATLDRAARAGRSKS